MKNNYEKITKKNTKTFYYSTIFFPKKIKNKIFLLYSFVRIIDDFVDNKIPKKKDFLLYKKQLNLFLKKNKKSKIKIINDIGYLIKEFKLEEEIEKYLNAQQKELKTKKYKTEKEFLEFTYGVAGVIGLMIAKILNLPKNSYQGAIKLGQSLQIINNIRDLYEDFKSRKKIYVPKDLLKKFNLNEKNFLENNNQKKLIEYLSKKTFKFYQEAEKSFKYIDKKYFLPIKIASDLYFQTLKKILKNPKLIFKKTKPTIIEILTTIIKNFVLIYGFNKKN